MFDDIFISTGFNTCMLVVLAYIMTKLDFVKRIILNREGEGLSPKEAGLRDIRNRICLGILMGAFCILSNVIGFQAKTAIPNARVIGALSAGIVGGPISGTIASVMGAVHRYLGDPARITTPACVVATLIQGACGSILWYKRKHHINYSALEIYLITFTMEVIHMLMIYFMARPVDQAVRIIRQISPSMVFVNPLGMILVFSILKDTFNQEDRRVAVRLSDSFKIAERCIPYLKNNGDTNAEARQILQILMEESNYAGAAILRGDQFLACSSIFEGIDVAKSQKDGTDPFVSLRDRYVIYMEDVEVKEKQKDQLILLGKKNDYSNRADIAFIQGLASLFSTYMKISELEEQRDLRRKAELQALQSQINPHFLFNSLTTISCFCREKPEKARELLFALSTYFRNSLQDAETMIPLWQELAHVKSYLMLEEARFEEHLRVEIHVEPDSTEVLVPNLILQPLVENAVKHGAKTRVWGVVRINIHKETDSVVVDIMDNGPGIPEKVIQSLHQERVVPVGIGFINVHKRLVGIFGPDSGLQVGRTEDMTRVRVQIPVNQR